MMKSSYRLAIRQKFLVNHTKTADPPSTRPELVNVLPEMETALEQAKSENESIHGAEPSEDVSELDSLPLHFPKELKTRTEKKH
jgi:hypothetical protein